MCLQLYAAIQEWRTGVQKKAEFSTNAYIDVYNGHINTFQHIRVNREEAFHTMMADIYQQARWTWPDFVIMVQLLINSYSVAGVGIVSSAAIADIEFNDMDG